MADPKELQLKRDAIKRAKERRKKEVSVVNCPGAFPISSKSTEKKVETKKTENFLDRPAVNTVSSAKVLDWNQTVDEVRTLGASAFGGKQKRSYEDEQYELLTGRKRKKQQVPLPIVRGIKKKAAAREAARLKEAKDAGIILPKKPRVEKKHDNTSQIYGPAPSAGFMKKGVLKIKKGHTGR